MTSRDLKSKLILIWMTFALAVSASGSDPATTEQSGLSEDSAAVYERRVDLTVDGLSHAVDLWHDANLLGNEDLIARYEILIDNILRADIKATEMVLKTLEAECHADGSGGEPKTKAELEDCYRILYEKEKLAGMVRRADTFSDKYRHLGGYINALRRELGMPRLRLAEDKEAIDDSPSRP